MWRAAQHHRLRCVFLYEVRCRAIVARAWKLGEFSCPGGAGGLRGAGARLRGEGRGVRAHTEEPRGCCLEAGYVGLSIYTSSLLSGSCRLAPKSQKWALSAGRLRRKCLDGASGLWSLLSPMADGGLNSKCLPQALQAASIRRRQGGRALDRAFPAHRWRMESALASDLIMGPPSPS